MLWTKKVWQKYSTFTPCKGITGHLFIKIIVDIGVTNSQPPNEPKKKDEVRDIETNKGKLLDRFYLFLSKLYNLAEEMEIDSLHDQEDTDPGIRKVKGEKCYLWSVKICTNMFFIYFQF